MEQITFLTGTLSFLLLLLIASFTFLVSRKINFPYTVLLVIVGLFLVPLANTETFAFINHFKLTPDILFFVFLPILLFEASYKIDYKKIIKDWKTIWMLAVFWLMLSAVIIGWGLYFIFALIGLEIPFLVTLLFWVIISATDPVAVLAIFHSIWAPRRLALLFEWESLFNDGTAVALFLVVLGIIMSWAWIDGSTFVFWWISFLTMMIGWAIFGWLAWMFFSKMIGYVKNDEGVEIVLTMVLAHLTFVVAELITHYFHHTLHINYIWISWVVATVIAWIVMWNYWRYKVTPKVEKHVRKFWEFMAFISNSIVFILIGLILSDIDGIEISQFIMPVLITLVVVSVARWISIYLPIGLLNFLKVWERVPMNWQHVLSWWSLRWALALMMVLLIPGKWQEWFEKIQRFQDSVGWNYDFSIKDFILILVIGSIMFTLIIKATTIPALMRKTKVSKLHSFEKFEYFEGNILMMISVLSKLDMMYKKWWIIKKEYKHLKSKYGDRLEKWVKDFRKFLKDHDKSSEKLIRRAVSLHSLWAEKKFLKELFLWNEIGEKNFRYILRKIEQQIDRLSTGKGQLRKVNKWENDYDIFQRIALWAYSEKTSPADIFIRNRARIIIIKRVIAELDELSRYDLGFDKNVFENIKVFYEDLLSKAKKKLNRVVASFEKTTVILDTKLAEKSIFALEYRMIDDMLDKWVISDKLYIKFKDEIEKDFYSDVKNDLETFC